MNNCTCGEHAPSQERQWWLIAAYALDLILVFALAFFFRIHLLRGNKRRPPGGSSGSNSSDDEIRLAANIPAFQIAKAKLPHHPIAI